MKSVHLQPLGKKWLEMPNKKKDDVDVDPALEKKLFKFQESVWKTIVFSTLSAVSAYALSKEMFWKDTAEFFTGCENSLPCKYEASSEVNFAYALGLAHYLYMLPYLVFFEVKRKDFWPMLSHHVATIVLIGYSFLLGYTKVGIVIMLLHDICDPFLELAKAAKYVKREALMNTSFVGLLLSWTLMRLIYFPFWVNREVLFFGYTRAVGEGNQLAFPHYQIMAGMLVFLNTLSAYWWVLIVKIAVNAVASDSSLEDSREDDSDSD